MTLLDGRRGAVGGVLTVDTRGEVIACSSGFARWLGYERSRDALTEQESWRPSWEEQLEAWWRGDEEPQPLTFQKPGEGDTSLLAYAMLFTGVEVDPFLEISLVLDSGAMESGLRPAPLSLALSHEELSHRQAEEAFFPHFLSRVCDVLGLERSLAAAREPGGLRLLGLHSAEAGAAAVDLSEGPLLERVQAEGHLVVPRDAAQELPGDVLVTLLGGEAVAGCLLAEASGENRGVLLVGGSQPMTNPEQTRLLLRILGGCACHELRLKATEAALQNSSQRYRRYFEQDLSGAYVSSPQGRLLACNAAFVRIFGFASIEEALGTNVRELYFEGGLRDRYLEYLKEHDAIERVEAKLRRRDGTPVHLLVTSRAVKDEHGEVVEITGSLLDTSQRKRAERRLREQAALLDETTDAIVQCSLEGEILFWNRGAERTYGWPEAEILQRPYSHLHGNEQRAAAEDALSQVIDNGEWDGNLRQLRRDGGGIVVQVRGTLVRDRKGQPRSVLFIGTDITEKLRLEEQIFRSQRLESLGTLAGGIAHDLNNVLAPIMMSLKLLRAKLPEESDQDLLGSLEASVQRGADLVKQVLWFARGVEGERTLVRPSDLIREIQQICSDTFTKKIQVILDYPPILPPVLGDATQLYQVLMNLALNARDAMPEGGLLRISAARVELGEEDVQARGVEGGPYVRIEVQDEGSGIAPGELERIFDPFFTTKGVGKGTGLGLATAHSIVEGHGGFLDVESRLGEGSTFRVFLPARDTGRATPAADQRAERHRFGDGRTILVVDDEPAVQRATQEALRSYGFEVMAAGDGASAVSHFSRQRDSIDAVICDLAMPGVDGRATIRSLRRLRRDLPVVACSGLPEPEAFSEVEKEGPFVSLSKPFSAEDLMRALGQVLELHAQAES